MHIMLHRVGTLRQRRETPTSPDGHSLGPIRLLHGSDGTGSRRASFAEETETARLAERMARNARKIVVPAEASRLGLSVSLA